MFGTIVGDVIGSSYEGLLKQQKKDDFLLFTKYSRFTDDTVTTIAIMEACMEIIKNEFERNFFGDFSRKIKKKLHLLDEEQEKLEIIEKYLRDYGKKYPDAGYGYGFMKWLNDENLGPYNSYGNGSAMRVSAIPWLYNDMEEIKYMAKLSAMITHNHPEGIKGAVATACAIFFARMKKDKADIKDCIEKEFNYNLSRSADEIREEKIISATCMDIVPEAIIAFLDSDSFEDAIRNAVSFGGDTDTIAAIAGGIAEAYYGGIPSDLQKEVQTRLPKDLYMQVERFWEFVYHIRSISPDSKKIE